MDYKSYFDKFVADFYKQIEEAKVQKESIKILTTHYEKSFSQLEELTNAIKESNLKIEDPFVSNKQFQRLMGISARTAQIWRNDKKIGYSKIADKIFYRRSDIEKLLNDNYHGSLL